LQLSRHSNVLRRAERSGPFSRYVPFGTTSQIPRGALPANQRGTRISNCIAEP
jgi:hypothetical protein